MTILSRIFLVVAVLLLGAVEPAWAQNGAGTQGTDPGSSSSATVSDQSGAAVTQSDIVTFQADGSQVQLNDVASALTEALQTGTLGASVVGNGQSMVVSPVVTTLFTAHSKQKANAIRQFVEVMTSRGLPGDRAQTLAEATAGLLNGDRIDSAQFQQVLQAFNTAVDAAPARFLMDPPNEFVAVRAILMSLLEGAV
jgi:hypothetical protein